MTNSTQGRLHSGEYFWAEYKSIKAFPGGSDGKASVHNVGDLGSIPGSGRFPGEGNGNPLQYSCLENPIDGGAWCPWGRKASLRAFKAKR